jgi:outer membrane immunogenic protein
VTTVTPLFASGHVTADVVRAGASYRFGDNGGAHAEVSDARPAPTSWNGFYLGIHGGGGFGTDPFNFAGAEPSLTDLHAAGWVAGGQAGANWQSGRWLAGVEVDASTTDIKGSTSGTLVIVAPSFESETINDKFNLLGSSRARLGWLPWPNILVYGTGGLAWAQLTQGGVFQTSSFGTTTASVSSIQSWRWGWAAGLGAETRIGHGNWLGRLEYLHYDFGTSLSSSTVSAGTTSVANEGRLTTDVVRLGLSYQLN